MKNKLYKHIFAGLLLFSAGSGLRAQVPVLEFYKDGKVIYTDQAQTGTIGERPVGAFEVLSAEEHPVTNHIKVDRIEIVPNPNYDGYRRGYKDTFHSPWSLRLLLATDLNYGGNQSFYMKVEPKLHVEWDATLGEYRYKASADGVDSISIVKSGNVNLSEWAWRMRDDNPFDYLEANTEYTFTFYEEAYGLTFKTDEVKVKTGYSTNDVMVDYKVASLSQTSGGTQYLMPESVVQSFMQKHQLGNTSSYMRKCVEEYLVTYNEVDIKKICTEISVYDGTLLVLNEIPDAAADYLVNLLSKPCVTSGGEYVLPTNYNNFNEPTMDVTEIALGGTAFWEIKAKISTNHTEVQYDTNEQLQGKYVNLYVTMASGRGQDPNVEESLPVSFTAECQVLNEEGKYVRSGIDAEGTPVTNNGYLCNQHTEWNYDVPELQTQPNFQRCYLVKNDTGRKVYLGTVKVDNFGPMQLTFKSFGPASTKYKEKVYTRTLRIANIITEPFDTEEEAKAAINDSGNEKPQE